MDAEKHQIAARFTDISNFRGLRGLAPSPFEELRPVFVCINENTLYDYPGIVTSDFWPGCLGGEGNGHYIHETAYIFVCPAVTSSPVQPTRRRYNCPAVAEYMFQGGEPALEALINFPVYIILHEMVHFYLQGDNIEEEDEVYDWNIAIHMGDDELWRNPLNCELYAACKETSPKFDRR